LDRPVLSSENQTGRDALHVRTPLLRHRDRFELLRRSEAANGRFDGGTNVRIPNGFRPEGNRQEYLRNVVVAFAGVPVIVEFRNDKWQRSETFALLRDAGAGYCNVDMPHLDGLLAPSSDALGPVGYIRFHGRNAKGWWTGSNITRYNYAYTAQELLQWTDRIAEIEEQVADTYVFFNNHASGRAAKNAQMREALLDERYGPLAEASIAHGSGGTPEQAPRGFAESNGE
jgi:uncharacterized protein YecE (DUF72 family)